MRCQLTSWCPCAMATHDYFSHQRQWFYSSSLKPKEKIRESESRFKGFGKGLKFHDFSNKPPKKTTQPVGSFFVFVVVCFLFDSRSESEVYIT